MVYDSINASIHTPASNSKDFAKKKRVNRTAKLKQSKLDVRREQWLSQVKNKASGGVKMCVPEEPREVKDRERERECGMVKLEISVGGEESDSESPSNSPTSHTSSVSVANFTGSSGGSSSESGSDGSSSGFFSGNLTDEDDRHGEGDGGDGDDGDDCFDDWEAMADALAADDVVKDCEESKLESRVQETGPEPEPEPVVTKTVSQEDCRKQGSVRAWRPDDTSRPQSLPNLLKQNSFPMKSGMHMHHGVGFAPSSCPICCEDLDMTDTSFLPCPCGYRLCLFCHKRILEDNGRCPGCRQKYVQPDHGNAPTKLARCYSMNPRH